MFSYSNRVSIIAIAAAATLSGCAAGPRPVIDDARLKPIHTITVIYPGQAVYYGASAPSAVPIPIPGGGLIAAAIVGAVSGGIHAGTKKPAATFNDLVAAQVGDTKLSRRFVDGIEADLRNHGYTVREVDATDPALPKIVNETPWRIHASGATYPDSDAILAISFAPGYSSVGPLYPYRRSVTGMIALFKSDTYEPVLQQPLNTQRFSGPYAYATTGMIIKDLPNAISGLDETVMEQVALFDKALDVAQHKPAAE